jgi:UDP-glucose 4-epimerase
MRLRPDAAAVFNVCTGEATSVAELAHVIGELARKNPDVRYMPPRAGEIRRSLGDATAMRRGLGLGEMVRLRDGLSTVLSHLNAPH